MSKTNDIIDLTQSFTLADQRGLADAVIDLLDTDDSICYERECQNDSVPRCRTASMKNERPTKRPTAVDIAKTKIRKEKPCLGERKKIDAASPKSEKINKFGMCPICWDELGKNPLASTKCGHVYCIRCIEKYLKLQRKCPTCRRSLKGSSSYHPIYLIYS